MNAAETDRVFAGSIPQFYDQHMVPLIFEPYAADLAERAAALRPQEVLEVAAGTGAVTRELARQLPASTRIVATDLNAPMLQQAQARGTAHPVEWRQADALALPFEDGSFDAVVCQFGAMFFPDRARAYAEARRVLRPGGTLLFNVWDVIEENEFADVILQALARLYPDDPPRFMARVPHGYADSSVVARELVSGGFGKAPRWDVLAARSRAPNARIPAVAYCQGTPWRSEIEARAPQGLAEATDAAERALSERFGTGPVDGKIQAIVFTVAR